MNYICRYYKDKTINKFVNFIDKTLLLLNKKITSSLLNIKLRHGFTRGLHEKSGGFVNAGGWGTCKNSVPIPRGVHVARQKHALGPALAYHFHAASTRRAKNTRHAWKCVSSARLPLLTSTTAAHFGTFINRNISKGGKILGGIWQLS